MDYNFCIWLVVAVGITLYAYMKNNHFKFQELIMEIQIKKIFDDANIPTRGSEDAAGYDLYAYKPGDREATYIEPHSTKMIHTGIACAIPRGYFGAVFARSGLAKKHGLRPANCVGVVDAK